MGCQAHYRIGDDPMTFRRFYRAFSAVFKAFAVVLLVWAVLSVPALAAETLTVRACPTNEMLDSGSDPACEKRSLYIEDDGVCWAIKRDLEAGRLEALVSAFPETAVQYAAYSNMPADVYCVSSASRIVIPDITGILAP